MSAIYTTIIMYTGNRIKYTCIENGDFKYGYPGYVYTRIPITVYVRDPQFRPADVQGTRGFNRCGRKLIVSIVLNRKRTIGDARRH